MAEMKIRIVKKEKDGVTVSPAKGAEPVKMTWKEFEKDWQVKDNIWAVPNEKALAKIKAVDEQVDNAVLTYIMSGSINGDPGPEGLTRMLMLGESINKIQELLECTPEEAMALVKQRLDAVMKPDANGILAAFEADRRREYRQRRKERPVKHEPQGFAVLADNQALLELKKHLEK